VGAAPAVERVDARDDLEVLDVREVDVTVEIELIFYDHLPEGVSRRERFDGSSARKPRSMSNRE